MKVKQKVSVVILVSLILCLSSSAWGRSIVTGQVVDAQTGEPIEGAAVFIYWGKRGSGPPGLAAETVEVEVAEDLTDATGEFSVPKYWTWFKHYQMAVYKKGYVCWRSNKIFPSFEERRDFKFKNGMIVRLKRFKEEYSKEKHALYTSISAIHRPMPGIFDNAIISELELLYESKKKKKE